MNTANHEDVFKILAYAAKITDQESGNEFSNVFGSCLPEELQQALYEENLRARKDVAAVAAKQIMIISKQAQEGKDRLITELEALRAKESLLIEIIQDIESRQAYAKETGDYIQLFTRLNSICFHPGVGKVLYKSLALYKEWQNGATKAGPSADESTSSEVKEDSNDPAVGGLLG